MAHPCDDSRSGAFFDRYALGARDRATAHDSRKRRDAFGELLGNGMVTRGEIEPCQKRLFEVDFVLRLFSFAVGPTRGESFGVIGRLPFGGEFAAKSIDRLCRRTKPDVCRLSAIHALDNPIFAGRLHTTRERGIASLDDDPTIGQCDGLIVVRKMRFTYAVYREFTFFRFAMRHFAAPINRRKTAAWDR